MTTPSEVRQHLLEALHADLIGPFVPDTHPQGGQEVLPLPPSRWYLTGFLSPQGGRAPDADDKDSTDGELAAGTETQSEDAGSDEPEPKRPVRFPASMGLSVFLPPGQDDAIEVDVSYADYDKLEVPIDHEDKKRQGWKRVPHGPVRISVPLDPAALAKGVPVPESRGLVLRGELRTTAMDGLEAGTRVLSLFLVNDRTALEKDRDLNFAFQVRLALHYGKGFRCRPNRRGEEGSDDDQRVLALTFRDHMEWAVGHNTSVEKPQSTDGKVTDLCTTQLPAYEVPTVVPRTFDDVTTGMAQLAKLNGAALANALTPLADAYAGWIEDQKREPLDRSSLEETRENLMHKAERCRQRIVEGIELLGKDPQVLLADRVLLCRPAAERTEVLSAQKRLSARQSFPNLRDGKKDPRFVLEVRAVDLRMLVEESVQGCSPPVVRDEPLLVEERHDLSVPSLLVGGVER